MKKKNILFIIPIIFIGIALSLFIFNNKEYKIKRVLNNEYYSYLPEEAKKIVKEIYEETGEIVPTEKNKEVNKPYLNPKYVTYLQLSSEEKNKVELIPEMYSVDYDYATEKKTVTANETSYDLRSINSRSYITPINLKDQGQLGICWAFSLTEQAESFLMVKNNQPYTSGTSKIFSPRQIDYGTSTNGITDYENEHGVRTLASGGNFYDSSEFLEFGLSLVDETKMPFDESTDTKELSDVLSFANSNYEVNSTINMPNLATDDNHANYINQIKDNIKSYGGAVVETVSPQSYCGFKNTNNTYAIETSAECFPYSGGHAMHIIGWDDNYSYTYCKNGNQNLDVNSNGSCSSGTKVTGTGAFLVRNSWGNHTMSYIYLTYNSFNTSSGSSQVHFITDMTSTIERNWDNYYKKYGPNDGYIHYGSATSETFTKKIESSEKLRKIKFSTFSSNGTYNIRVVADGNTYNSTLTTTYPGIYSVDLSSKNIILDSDSFSVEITTNNGWVVFNSIVAYTYNNDGTPRIKRKGPEEIVLPANPSTQIQRIIYDTKNINSGESVSFALKEKYTGNDKSSYIYVTNNKVANNKINPKVQIATLPVGEYLLTASYNGKKDELPIIVGPQTANVTYYANNGTSDSNEVTVDKRTAFTIINNPFSYSGHIFKEWNTKQDGTGTSYQEKQSVTDGITTDLNLYAIWDEENIEITSTPTSINYGEVYSDFSSPVKKYITIKNTGNSKAKLSLTNPTSSGPFGSQNFENGKVLNPGEQYQVTLIANPSGTYHNIPGTYNGTYSVTATSLTDSTKKHTVDISAQIIIKKKPMSISYTTHVQYIGWQNYVKDGAMAGTSGQSLRLEGIKIKLDNQDYSGDVEYTTHVQYIGWQNYVKNDQMAGTSGKGLRLEGIKIRLTGEMAEQYDVYYRVHAENFGWLGWARNDEESGTAGYGYRLEGINIKLVPKGQNFSEYGLKSAFQDKYPVTSVSLNKSTTTLEVGDEEQLTKTINPSNASNKEVTWTSDNESVATVNQNGKITAIREGIARITVTSKNGKRANCNVNVISAIPGIEYTTHVQYIGWQDYVKNGAMAGTSGKGLRLEGLKVRLKNVPVSGNVMYTTHVQNIGWQLYVSDNQMAGTSGMGLRLEGTRIKLTGQVAEQYDVYYRVHAENFGWLAWAKNGEDSGTAGFGFRLEGIEIVLVNKGESPPSRSNQNQNVAFIQK